MRALLAASLLGLTTAASAATALTGATVLRHPLSARAAGMGEALTAVDAGTDSLGVNPAGASTLTRPEVLSTFASGVADDTFGFLGYAHPLPHGVALAGLTYYDAGKVDIVSPGGATSSVSAENDYVGALGYSTPLFAGLSAGFEAKYYRFTLAQAATASGFAADFGAQWETPVPGVRLGAALQNAGAGVKYEAASDPLPLTGRAGVAWSAVLSHANSDAALTGTALTLSADAVQVRGEAVAPVAGGEFTLSFGQGTAVSVRTAYTFDQSADGVSFGVGVREGRFTADYALVAKRDLGNVQDVSLRVRF
jgi:hypothetical protein